MYSTTTRITGLSGFDTEGMVKSLMQAESIKYTNLLKKATLTTYKQDAYKSVTSTLSTFQSQFLAITGNLSNSIRAFANFKTTSATVKISGSDKDTTDIKIGAGTATAGTYKLTVHSIAKKDQFTGSVSFNPSLTGKAYEEYTETIVNEDGDEEEITLTRGLDPSKLQAGDNFRISLDGATSKAITFSETDIADIETDGFESVLNKKLKDAFGTDAASGGQQKVTAKVQNGALTLEALPGHSMTVYNGNAGTLDALGLSNGEKTSVSTVSQTLGQLLGANDSDANPLIKVNGVEIELDLTKSVNDIMTEINEKAGVNMRFDETRGTFVLESAKTGAVNSITFSDDSASGIQFFNKLGISEAARTATASDAIVTLNGVTTSREDNSFTIEGLSITLSNDSVNWNGITPVDKEFTINVANDTSNVKQLITNFINGYNDLIDSLNSLYKTARPKSATGDYYLPLTDDEKSAMSESQIKAWEENAKTGLLFRDPIVEKIMSDLRSQMTSALVLNDGTKISLASIGITTTSNVGDGGKLKIDDETKLDAALADRPDAVAELFTRSATNKETTKSKLATEGLSERLNDVINSAIGYKGSIYKKIGTEGDTNSERNSVLYKELAAQNEKISQMLTYLQRKEDYYYSMFARMEAAMSKADSQLSSIQSILGS